MFWGLSAILLKVMVFATVVVTPLQMLMAEDFLETQAGYLYELTNDLRESQDLQPLNIEFKLEQSSDSKVTDIVSTQDFSHSGLKDYLAAVDYNYKLAGENLARGFYNADNVLKAWKESPTHYANLIDPNYKDMGISLKEGQYQGQPTIFIAHHFGTSFEEPSLAKSLTAATLINNKDANIDKYQTFKSEANSNSLVQNIYLALIGLFGLALAANIILEFKRHHIHVYMDAGLFLLLIVALILV